MRVIPLALPDGACGFVATVDDLTMACALPKGHVGLHSVEAQERNQRPAVPAKGTPCNQR